VSFGALAVIGLCGLAGPMLSAAGRGTVPVVVGEILAGVILGRTGFAAIDTTNTTLSFLSDVGFAMLMFTAGMNVPLRDRSMHASLDVGAAMAAMVAMLAVGAGLLVSGIGAVGHPAVYAVLIASGSAAVVLPTVQERGLAGPVVLAVMAQVTVADIGATLAVPLVLRPSHAAGAALGTVIVAGCVVIAFALTRRLRARTVVQELRRMGKKRRWALDLRLALVVLFALGWIAQRSGASLLVAGFGAGLMVAAIGGPKRLSTEVLGIGGGFFIPLFFVVLGARIDLRGLVSDPGMLGLVGALAALNVAVHTLVAKAAHQPSAAGLVASAQLGVPAAIIALGLPEHVITPVQAAAILAAALLSVFVCSLGAAALHARQEQAERRSPVTPAQPLTSPRSSA
jgi:Kef-type K+ transport system membrane component KefB